MIGIDTGNTAWILIAAAMVFFMTPGLALFCGGMARRIYAHRLHIDLW